MKFLSYLDLQEKIKLADELGLTPGSSATASKDVETVVTSTELEKYKQGKPVNSAAIIKDALEYSGLGIDKIRQTKTKENTSTSIYKKNGFSIDAVWISEKGPMEDEGYSVKDGENKLNDLLTSFEKQGGRIIKRGTTKENSQSVLQFEDDFKIIITPFILNSAIDGSGFDRTFLIIETK